jgi:aryl-alcohol dehydrogenase-like predicted oxidoreductase
LKHNPFGKTGLTVSELGFGCARLGGLMAAGASRREPLDVLLRAYEQGITFFDTADMYTQGESETLVGRAFAGKRDRVVIASKGGYCLPAQRKLAARIKPLIKPLVRALGIKRQSLPSGVSGSLSQDFSPAYLTGAIEASLRRLNTDHLDIYQVHSPPKAVIESGEFIETLEKLKAQGKTRFYGVACDTMEDAILSLKYPGVSSVMFPFGLLDQEGHETLFARAEAQGVALIARGCFGGGLLKTSLSESELKAITEKWPRILAYRRLAAQQNRSLLELALQYSRSFPAISVHLLGMRTETHLRENLQLLGSSLLTSAEQDELKRIDLLPLAEKV